MDNRKTTIYDFRRMCNNYNTCEYCPLSHNNNSKACSCGKYIQHYTDKANEIILKWCDEHPVKTYADDFYEKFPNAERDNQGVPPFCPKMIYPQFGECPDGGNCDECWEKEYKECNEKHNSKGS